MWQVHTPHPEARGRGSSEECISLALSKDTAVPGTRQCNMSSSVNIVKVRDFLQFLHICVIHSKKTS